MTMMKYILHIVIHIPTQIAVNFFRDYVLLRVRIELEKQSFVKLLRVMIVKWQ
jgi:hypothetical protein